MKLKREKVLNSASEGQKSLAFFIRFVIHIHSLQTFWELSFTGNISKENNQRINPNEDVIRLSCTPILLCLEIDTQPRRV